MLSPSSMLTLWNLTHLLRFALKSPLPHHVRADLTILHIPTALVSTWGQDSPQAVLYEKNERGRLRSL